MTHHPIDKIEQLAKEAMSGSKCFTKLPPRLAPSIRSRFTNFVDIDVINRFFALRLAAEIIIEHASSVSSGMTRWLKQLDGLLLRLRSKTELLENIKSSVEFEKCLETHISDFIQILEDLTEHQQNAQKVFGIEGCELPKDILLIYSNFNGLIQMKAYLKEQHYKDCNYGGFAEAP